MRRLGFWRIGIVYAFVFVSAALVAERILADDSTDRVRSALGDLDRWLATSPHGANWHRHLNTDQLRNQLRLGAKADRAKLKKALDRFRSGAPGLQSRRFAAVRDALDRWLQSPPQDDPTSDSPTLGRFTAPSDSDVNTSKARLFGTIQRLDAFLAQSPSRGWRWRDYLKLELMQQQLGADRPDRKQLETVVSQFAKDHPGLEMSVFRDVRDALRKYVDTSSVYYNLDKVGPQVAKMIDDLMQDINSYGPYSTHRDAVEIARRLSLLERYGQVPELVQSTRRNLSRPNLAGYISEGIVQAGMQDTVSEPTSMRTNIMGTHVVASGYTTGTVTPFLVPDATRAVIELRLNATTNANSTGYHPKATIWSQSRTQLSGGKRLIFTPDGFSTQNATASASTASTITGARTKRGRRLGNRIATKKANQQKGSAEHVASGKARNRLSSRMDSEAVERLDDANQKYRKNFRNPLARRDFFPQVFRLRTTSSAIHVTLQQATADQLAAPQSPAPLSEGSDLAVRLHESMVNNFAAVYLGGTTLTNEDVKEESDESKFLTDWLDRRKEQVNQRRRQRGQPEIADEQKEQDPWEMTFAKYDPVSVEFRNSTVKFTIRATQFVGLDEQVYKRPMSIWAIYSIETDQYAGLRLTLQQWDVTPTGVERGGKFRPADAPLRSKLRARFKDVLEGEDGENKVVEVFPLEFPGEFSRVGKLAYSAATSEQGWLTFAWNRLGYQQATLPRAYGVAERVEYHYGPVR